jgi:type VI secretion system protein ImpH
MAEKAGTTTADEQLAFICEQAKRVSFYQAVLTLERIFADAPAVGEEGPAGGERVRLRPSVSMSCPPADLESIRPLKDHGYQITTTFLGLYGADSPLPYYYPEHIAQIAEEESGERVRAFLDIFHHRLLSLLYRSWKKSRPVSTSAVSADPLYDRVLALVGWSGKHRLGGKRRPRLAEARLQVLQARTASGLAAMIELRLGYPCRVDQLQHRWVTIPEQQRTRLGQQGSVLGTDFVLGRRLVDCNKIRIRFSVPDFATYERLLPSGPDRGDVEHVIERYLKEPIDYDLEVTLPSEQVRPWRLGVEGALGHHCWIGRPRPTAVCRWSCQSMAGAA